MTGWAVFLLDFRVHVLAEGDFVGGVLAARCGHQLPTMVHQHDQPPPGPPCEDCRVIFLADRALLSRIRIREASSPPVLPVGRRWRPPTPDGRPDPRRWARCPVDRHQHLLAPCAATGPAYALCGRRMSVEGVTLRGLSAALCVSCLAAGRAS